jgi:hypothetical protein
MLANENRTEREAAAARRAGNIGFGVEAAATLGLGFYCWLAAIRVVSGPGIFERVGLRWAELAGVYFAVCLGAMYAWGALEHKRHHRLVAMLQGFLMYVPLAVAIPVNFGLSWGRVPSVPGDLVLPLIGAMVVGGAVGLWVWHEDRRAERPSGS